LVWKKSIKIYQKRHNKKSQQQKEAHVSSNINQLSRKLAAMSFTSFSLSIADDLFDPKIAGYICV